MFAKCTQLTHLLSFVSLFSFTFAFAFTFSFILHLRTAEGDPTTSLIADHCNFQVGIFHLLTISMTMIIIKIRKIIIMIFTVVIMVIMIIKIVIMMTDQ